MDLIYQEYFGFSEAPFNITPDPGFLYLSASHREGLAQLSYGIKARKGFVVLTGEVGTGKTTLVHALLNELNGNTQTALVFSAIMNPVDLLRYVCDDFGLTDPRQPLSDIHDYLVLLNEYLLSRYRSGENCALIIDEAQNLPTDVLESIRILSNFETSKDKLLQILLVGQPELSARLNSQELRQLKQRVALRHHLRCLTIKECQEYIVNRLEVAHGDTAIFTSAAVDAVYSYSKGIPRIINVLSDNALLNTYALGKKRVDDLVVSEVAEDLSLSNGSTELRSLQSLSPRLNNASRLAQKVVPFAQPVISQAEPRIAVGSNSTNGAGNTGKVSEKFFYELTKELAEAMGPMASIVLKDNLRRLGQSAGDFPKKKLTTLIDSVSSEILDGAIRRKFCTTALDKLRELGDD